MCRRHVERGGGYGGINRSKNLDVTDYLVDFLFQWESVIRFRHCQVHPELEEDFQKGKGEASLTTSYRIGTETAP